MGIGQVGPGSIGYSGYSGRSGYSGFSGAGSAGASGASGYSGFSGSAAAGLTVGTTAIANGADTQVLFQDGSALGEDAGLAYNKTTNTLSTTGGGVSTQALNATTVNATNIEIAAAQYYSWNTRSIMYSPADGVIRMANAAETDFGRLQLGGTTSSFPSLKRSAAAVELRLADDSASTSLTASTATLNALASDATHTDATVCADASTGLLYKGSGTIGICLGTSSERYKEHVNSLDSGLAAVMALNPVSYFYKKGYGNDGEKVLYGLTAEGVVDVLPDLVGLDAEGKPNSVDLMGLLPVLVNALKEQQEEIETLKDALEVTNSRVETLVN